MSDLRDNGMLKVELVPLLLPSSFHFLLTISPWMKSDFFRFFGGLLISFSSLRSQSLFLFIDNVDLRWSIGFFIDSISSLLKKNFKMCVYHRVFFILNI